MCVFERMHGSDRMCRELDEKNGAEVAFDTKNWWYPMRMRTVTKYEYSQ